jgi:cation:H+ antiporter
MNWTTLAYLGAGLVLLYAGGEGVVRGAASLGLRCGLSALATGLTIVAFGTSAPELIVNLQAAALGVGDMAIGNVVGSNIANIGLVLGVSVLIKPVRLDVDVIRRDIYIMMAAGVIATAFLIVGRISRIEGAVLAALIAAYVWYNLRAAGRERAASKARFEEALSMPEHTLWLDLMLVIGSLAALAGGGSLFVRGAVDLAAALGMAPAVIGLTVVAIGTSLPELAATAIAAYRGYGDMAIGNVVGSNIFNILSVLGLTSLVYPLERGDVGTVDLAVFLLSGAVLLRLMLTDSRMDRWEGAVLFLGFCTYLAWRVS